MTLEYVPCNLCGSTDSVVLYPSTLPENESDHDLARYNCTCSGYGQHYAIVRCRRCGLTYTNPRRKEDDILDDYQEVEDSLYLEEREGRVLTFQRNLRPLESLAPPLNGSRLLDVGCHIGVFVEIARERGWDAWGVEPSRWATSKAEARGLRVVNGTLHQAAFPTASFDVVTMWDVIEHLADPRSEVTEVYRILKPGGLFSAHTINIESTFARLMGHHWPWLMEMHLFYFSPRTLRRMLEDVGFQVLRWTNQGRYLHLGYLISRLQAYSPVLSRGMNRTVHALRLQNLAVPVNFGDLFTMFARKPL
ncbi:MAG: class I SAM-dependent methyltransferase [Chloroflexota bacterium]|nr:class I SAM-dependent methyltransferase [Chloroflexota bacterium]